MNVQIAKQIVNLRSEITLYQNGQKHPAMVPENAHRYKSPLVNWEDANPAAQKHGVDVIVHQLTSRIRGGEQHIEMMSNLADKVHGTAHKEVKISKLPKVEIKVGDRVKVAGREVTVTKIAEARAHGAGPALNGNYMDHVFWEQNGKTYSHPKKLARLIANQEVA